MEQLINNLEDIQELIEKAKTPRVYGKEEIAKDMIKDFLPDLEEKYPEAVQCIRELLDTMEEEV